MGAAASERKATIERQAALKPQFIRPLPLVIAQRDLLTPNRKSTPIAAMSGNQINFGHEPQISAAIP
jgi:hypothetical protein